jgi:hypothetical protein
MHRLVSETNNGPAEIFAEVVVENTYEEKTKGSYLKYLTLIIAKAVGDLSLTAFLF